MVHPHCGSDRVDLPSSPSREITAATLIYDIGSGFRDEQAVHQPVSYETGTFDLTMSLAAPTVVKRLCWHPLATHSCRLRLEGVDWIDRRGQATPIDLATITCNGRRSEEGDLDFDTSNPLVLLPIDAEVTAIRVRGRCQVEPLTASLDRLRRLREEQQRRLDECSGQMSHLETLCQGRAMHIAELECLLRHRERSALGELSATLFVDTGVGFRNEESIAQVVTYDPPEFDLSFALPAGTVVRRLRWDPLENHSCHLRMEELSWEDASGVTRALDLTTITTNGTRTTVDEFAFDTLDPILWLPIEGPVSRVRIRGRCRIELLAATLPRLRLLIAGQANEIRDLQKRLTDLQAVCDGKDKTLADYDAYCRLAEPQLQQAWAETEDLRRQVLSAQRESYALAEEIETIRHKQIWAPIYSVGSALTFLPRVVGRWFRRNQKKDDAAA
jgi:hypothetical protein